MANFGAFLQGFTNSLQAQQEMKMKRDFMESQKKLLDTQIKAADAENEHKKFMANLLTGSMVPGGGGTPAAPTIPQAPALSASAGAEVPFMPTSPSPAPMPGAPQAGGLAGIIAAARTNPILRGMLKKEIGLDLGEITYKGGLAGEGGKPTMKGFDITGAEIPGVSFPEAEKPETAMQKFNQSAKLRGEFTDINKTFRDVRDSYARIQASAESPSAAGDLALIFNYMKMLDPGSTVREGEFANAQNSGGVPDIVRAQYNKLMSGERLSSNIREDFTTRATMLYDKAQAQYGRNVSEFTRLADQLGLNPKEVIVDFGMVSGTGKPGLGKNPPKLGASETKTIGNQTYIKKGGKWYASGK